MPLIRGRVRRRALIYVLDAFLIGVAILGIHRLQSRGRMPAELVKTGSTFVVKATLQTTEENPFEIEDELLAINGLSVFSNFEIEFLTDQHCTPSEQCELLEPKTKRPISHFQGLADTSFEAICDGIHWTVNPAPPRRRISLRIR